MSTTKKPAKQDHEKRREKEGEKERGKEREKGRERERQEKKRKEKKRTPTKSTAKSRKPIAETKSNKKTWRDDRKEEQEKLKKAKALRKQIKVTRNMLDRFDEYIKNFKFKHGRNPSDNELATVIAEVENVKFDQALGKLNLLRFFDFFDSPKAKWSNEEKAGHMVYNTSPMI